MVWQEAMNGVIDVFAYPRFATAAALLLSVALFSVAHAQDDDAWQIAIAGPMSGDNESLGRAMVNSVQLRVDEVNEAGGIDGKKIRIVIHDDQNDPDLARKVASEIAADGRTLLVIGHRASGPSIVASEVYKEAGIPMITGTATAEEVTRNNKWSFRIIYDNKLQADFIANYINTILDNEYTTLIHNDSAYGKSLAEAFRTTVAGIPLKISREYEIASDDPDMDITMLGIVSELSLAPDSGMIFLALDAKEAALFVTEMRNSGFAFPIFAPDSINQSFPQYFEADDILRISQGDFTDQIYATTSMIWDVATVNANRFRKAFEQRFEHSPNAGEALYFDAASLALEALEKADLVAGDRPGNSKKIRDYLSGKDSLDDAFTGVTGAIYFDGDGNALKTVPIGIFQQEAFISAPVQLEPVIDPVKVPNFAEKREQGNIIPYRDGYAHATQIVYVGIDLNEVSNLDTATGNYVMDFYLWLRFRGDLNIDDIYFANSVSDIKLGKPIWSRERQGMTVVTYKVRGLFHGDFEFQEYPFDSQQIVLQLRHRNRTRESLTFVADRLGMQLTGEGATLLERVRENRVFRTTPGWTVTDATIYQDLVKTASTLGETVLFEGEAEINFSRINLVIDISRGLSSSSSTILLPLAILFIIGMLIYLIPIVEIAPRVSAGVLVLITVSLLRARLANDLTNVGYLVAVDYVFFVFQIVMVFGISISIVSYLNLMREKVSRAQAINRYGAIAHPVPMLVLMVVMWWVLGQ
jgi:branched-chain amino acid transport system substrate-binding protein